MRRSLFLGSDRKTSCSINGGHSLDTRVALSGKEAGNPRTKATARAVNISPEIFLECNEGQEKRQLRSCGGRRTRRSDSEKRFDSCCIAVRREAMRAVKA